MTVLFRRGTYEHQPGASTEVGPNDSPKTLFHEKSYKKFFKKEKKRMKKKGLIRAVESSKNPSNSEMKRASTR